CNRGWMDRHRTHHPHLEPSERYPGGIERSVGYTGMESRRMRGRKLVPHHDRGLGVQDGCEHAYVRTSTRQARQALDRWLHVQLSAHYECVAVRLKKDRVRS